MKESLFPLFQSAKNIFQIVFFLLTGTLLSAQNVKTYASNQTNQLAGICIGCNILNPYDAVGENNNNYSTLQIGLGVLGRAEQTLIFPQVSKGDLTIEIGTGNVPLSLALLSGVTIETLKGTIPNNDAKTVNSSILRLGLQDNRGTIQLNPKKDYDRVRISLGGTVALNDGLRIYRAFTHTGFLTECGAILPPDPFLYSSFQNEDDVQPDEDLACGQSFHEEFGELKSAYIESDTIYKRTVSFWAGVEGSLRLNTHGTEIFIGDNQILLECAAGDRNTQANFSHPTNGAREHYLIEIIPIYRTGGDLSICQFLADPDQCLLPVELKINMTIRSASGMQSHTVTLGPTILKSFKSSKDLRVSLKNASVDEILVYDRMLNNEEIRALTCSYSLPDFNAVNCLQNNRQQLNEIIPSTEILTVSPNPTNGEVRLRGNILFVDADISLHNVSGKEVYHGQLSSDTFRLPDSLPAGIYVLKVLTGKGDMYSKKIILNR